MTKIKCGITGADVWKAFRKLARKPKTKFSFYRLTVCPRCDGKLVLRHGRGGKAFYGCSNYPKCKFTKKA